MLGVEIVKLKKCLKIWEKQQNNLFNRQLKSTLNKMGIYNMITLIHNTILEKNKLKFYVKNVIKNLNKCQMNI